MPAVPLTEREAEDAVPPEPLAGGVYLRPCNPVPGEALAFDVVREVCINGPGHFLGHDQTLGRMQSDYFYPALADRSTPEEWREGGAADLLARARHRTREILEGPRPAHVAGEVDREIRRRFTIHL